MISWEGDRVRKGIHRSTGKPSQKFPNQQGLRGARRYCDGKGNGHAGHVHVGGKERGYGFKIVNERCEIEWTLLFRKPDINQT